MILDRIENASLYAGLSERLKVGLDYISQTDFSNVPAGKYEIDGKMVYAMVNEYESKPASECKLESHIKYIDIQVILQGEEQVGFVVKTNQQPTIEYNPEKDVMFFQEEVFNFPFTVGDFAIFYPTDLHQPGIQLNGVSKVRKVVVKVAI